MGKLRQAGPVSGGMPDTQGALRATGLGLDNMAPDLQVSTGASRPRVQPKVTQVEPHPRLADAKGRTAHWPVERACPSKRCEPPGHRAEEHNPALPSQGPPHAFHQRLLIQTAPSPAHGAAKTSNSPCRPQLLLTASNRNKQILETRRPGQIAAEVRVSTKSCPAGPGRKLYPSSRPTPAHPQGAGDKDTPASPVHVSPRLPAIVPGPTRPGPVWATWLPWACCRSSRMLGLEAS